MIEIKETVEEIELGDSKSIFKLKGNNVNHVLLNTLRRTIYTDIPIYAFNRIVFEKNTSVYHNNYLKIKIENLPVWSIENDVPYIVHSNRLDNENDICNVNDLEQLTMFISCKNKGQDVINVTTDDAKFYYKGKQIKTPYKNAIPILKLKNGQEIVISAITNINTEEYGTKYSAVSICIFNKISDEEYILIIESRGQLKEKEILHRALINIIRRLTKIELEINKLQLINNEEENIIILEGEDHTMGNLLSNEIQNNKNIKYAAYHIPHPMEKILQIQYTLTDKTADIISIMKECIKNKIEFFEKMKKIL